MKEPNKSMQEMGIKTVDLKKLSPVGNIHSTHDLGTAIEVKSIYYFDEGDIPHNKPPRQCHEELDTFVPKQHSFNMETKRIIYENSCRIKYLFSDLEITMNDIRGIAKHYTMIQNQLDQIMKSQEKLLHDISHSTNKPQVYGVDTRGRASTEDPLYPEGHPKRIGQDKQKSNGPTPSSSKKNMIANVEFLSEDVRETYINEDDDFQETQNGISISNAETQSGEEEEPSHENNFSTQEGEETEKQDHTAEIDKDKTNKRLHEVRAKARKI